jgi:hypothetical protein
MGRVFSYRSAWALAGVIAFYLLLVKAIPFAPRGTALRGIFLVLSGWGMYAYWRPAWRALTTRDGWPSGPLLYALMVWLFCSSYNFNIAIATVWRLSGQPYYMINNSVFDFWLVLGICALAISISVPNLFGKDVPPQDKLQTGVVWLSMFALVMYLVLARPDLRPFAELMRPWLDTGHDYVDPD